MLFEQWFERQYAGSRAGEFEFVLVSESIEIGREASCHLDITTDTKMARVILWDRGFCDMESWDIERGELISWEHHEFTTWKEIEPVIRAFIEITLEGNHE